MAALIPVLAGRRYIMRTIVADDWDVDRFGGHPTHLRLVSPVVRDYPLPHPDGRWPGTGLVQLPHVPTDTNLVFEIHSPAAGVVRSDSNWADNAGSGITPAPSPYRPDEGVTPGQPFIRISWELTNQAGGLFDRNDTWTYIFGPEPHWWHVGYIGWSG